MALHGFGVQLDPSPGESFRPCGGCALRGQVGHFFRVDCTRPIRPLTSILRNSLSPPTRLLQPAESTLGHVLATAVLGISLQSYATLTGIPRLRSNSPVAHSSGQVVCQETVGGTQLDVQESSSVKPGCLCSLWIASKSGGVRFPVPPTRSSAAPGFAAT